jgi:hypothetical protein
LPFGWIVQECPLQLVNTGRFFKVRGIPSSVTENSNARHRWSPSKIVYATIDSREAALG